MQKRIETIAVGIVLLVLAGVIFFKASQIQQRMPIGVDSGFFPEVAALALGLLAVVIFFQGIGPAPDVCSDTVAPKGRKEVALSLLLIIAFGIGMDTIGFLPAAVLYLMAQFYVLSPPDQRRPLLFAAIALSAATVVFFVFTRGFGLNLPLGPGG